MIDIHTHILFKVDDGARSIEESLDMIKECEKQGVNTIVLTPHFYEDNDFMNNYLVLKEKTNCNLILSSEVYYEENFNKKYALFPKINDYVLLEFDRYENIVDVLYDLTLDGKKIILAHAERYNLGIEDIKSIKSFGVLIQVNSISILNNNKKAKAMLSEKLIDFIASDMHDLDIRSTHMKKAYDFVCKKVDIEYANKIFSENAQEILKIG